MSAEFCVECGNPVAGHNGGRACLSRSVLVNGASFRRAPRGSHGWRLLMWDEPVGRLLTGAGRWTAETTEGERVGEFRGYATRTEAANALARAAGYGYEVTA